MDSWRAKKQQLQVEFYEHELAVTIAGQEVVVPAATYLVFYPGGVVTIPKADFEALFERPDHSARMYQALR